MQDLSILATPAVVDRVSLTRRIRRRLRLQVVLVLVAGAWFAGGLVALAQRDLQRDIQELRERQAAGIAKRDEQIKSINDTLVELRSAVAAIQTVREQQIVMQARADLNSLYLQMILIPLGLLVVAKFIDMYKGRPSPPATPPTPE